MTTIEWAHAGLGRGETWNPIRAWNLRSGKNERGWHCEKVSPACANCYAERQNLIGARGGTKLAYKPGHRSDIEIYLDEMTLRAPLHWRQPRGIFTCSMTDAFGDWVSDEWLDNMFAVAALCPQHIFIFLTKRLKRMRAYLKPFDRRRADGAGFSVISLGYKEPLELLRWPLPNVWLGVTAEDQQRADERRDDLKALAEQGWTTIVSYEPALELVDWSGWEFVRQIICGGESGPGARPLHPDWARATRDFCEARDIAFFFKQWGEWAPESSVADDNARARCRYGEFHVGDSAWIDSCLCSEGAPGGLMFRVGKRRAGRLLDGREHNETPEARR